MKLLPILAGVAAAATFTSAVAVPENHIGSDLIERSAEGDLQERTLFGGGWCFSLLGISLGSCGYWQKSHYDWYKSECSKWSWQPKWTKFYNVIHYNWGNKWIKDIDWQYYGKWWLPKNCYDWKFECPDPWKPVPGCTQGHLDGYKKACHKLGHEPHYWYDSNKGGYWLFYKGKFIFQIDFIITKTGYCVPKWDSAGW